MMSKVLNLNNEVVRMRKVVKNARVFIHRKLTRQISVLKKKKGKPQELEKNQRRVERLVAEIQALKALKPDEVTKTALQMDLCFEKVCKAPNSTPKDRVMSRIVTHPHINKKILEIKAAVKAFEETRKNPTDAKTATSGTLVDSEEGSEGEDDDNDDDDEVTDLVEVEDSKKDTMISRQTTDEAIKVETHCISVKEASCSAKVMVSSKGIGKSTSSAEERKPSDALIVPNDSPDVTKVSDSQSEKKGGVSDDELESEVESLHEEQKEKEYFDDSTEERFHKQSSQSEESDEDDFFLGKVSKFKKNKSSSVLRDSKDSKKMGESLTSEPKPEAEVVAGGKEDDQSAKSRKLESTFCNTLAFAKNRKVSQRGPNAGKFQKQGRGQNFKTAQWENKRKGPDRRIPDRPLYQNRGKVDTHTVDKGQVPSKASMALTHNAKQQSQSLHPSWEASRRRKEQQAQIMAFQGKKIKFDDD